MFLLFFSLYRAMLTGTWTMFSANDLKTLLTPSFNAIGTIITSLFNNVDVSFDTLGTILFDQVSGTGTVAYIGIVSFILALITSIGIVVMAVKGIKRVFGVFFMGIR